MTFERAIDVRFFCESYQIQSSLGTTTHDVWSLNDPDLFDAVGRFYFQLLLTLPRQLLAGNFWSLKTIRWHQAIWILRHGSAIVLDKSFGKCTATLFPKQRIANPLFPNWKLQGLELKWDLKSLSYVGFVLFYLMLSPINEICICSKHKSRDDFVGERVTAYGDAQPKSPKGGI